MSHVKSIRSGAVVVHADLHLDARLRALGATRQLLHRRLWRFHVADDSELATLLSSLRDNGVAFAGGDGWPPAAQFARLRDLDLLAGPYVELVWRGPAQPHTIQHD